jgi:hypothetical protein
MECYRYLAATAAGFIQQLAVCYVKNNYWFYVTGHIREGKDAAEVDATIIGKYAIAMSKHVRHDRKVKGLANLQYLRFERFFVIIATRGEHAFLREEREAMRDIRETPLVFHDHAISYRGGHAHVRIERKVFRSLKAYFSDIAAKRPAAALAAEIRALPFERYAPVRRQLAGLLREVNRVRGKAGIAPVPDACVRTRRRVCRPFEPL